MEYIPPPLRALTRQPLTVQDDQERQLFSAPIGLQSLPKLKNVPTSHESPQTYSSKPSMADPRIRMQHLEENQNTWMTQSSPNVRSRRKNRIHVGFTTGEDNVDDNGNGHQRISERICPSPSPHEVRKRELLQILEPMVKSDASTLLLCWGEKEHCHILPAKIRDSADSIGQLSDALHAWLQHQASWRSWLPWYGVHNVTIIEVILSVRIRV